MRATTASGRRKIKLYKSNNENYQIICIYLSAEHMKSNELHGLSTETRRDKLNKSLGYLPSLLVAESDRNGGWRRQILYGTANTIGLACQTLQNQLLNSVQNSLKQLITAQVEEEKQAVIHRTDNLVTPQDRQSDLNRNCRCAQGNQKVKASVTTFGGNEGGGDPEWDPPSSGPTGGN